MSVVSVARLQDYETRLGELEGDNAALTKQLLEVGPEARTVASRVARARWGLASPGFSDARALVGFSL